VPVKVTAAPGSNVVPVGAVIATTGVALTVMVIMVWVVLPPLSVTVAVMVCVPVESALAVIVRPVPSAPSRLEVQAMVAERSPSSVSLAEPVKVTAAPGSNVAPVAGAVIRTAGVVLTVMVIEARPVLPPLSVAAAVVGGVPGVIVPPAPMAPSRLEVQAIAAVRLPSSRSLAVALRVTGAPGSKVAPAVGALIVTVGVLFTTTVIDARPVLLPLSVADAVIVWVPELSVPVVTLKPVPSAPSRSEDQTIDPVRVPSSRSVAVPVKVIGAPCSKVEPAAGALMVTVGVALTTIVRVVAARLPPASVTEAVIM